MQWVRNIWYIIFGRMWLCVYVRLREAIASLSLIAISRNVRHNDVRFTTSCRWNRIKLKYGASYRSTSDTTCCHLLFSNQLLTTYNFHIHATSSPGWGPRGQGPSNNRQGPDKITGLFMFEKSKKTKWQPCVPWRLEQTAESHSLLSRLSRAWPPIGCTRLHFLS